MTSFFIASILFLFFQFWSFHLCYVAELFGIILSFSPEVKQQHQSFMTFCRLCLLVSLMLTIQDCVCKMPIEILAEKTSAVDITPSEDNSAEISLSECVHRVSKVDYTDLVLSLHQIFKTSFSHFGTQNMKNC